MPLRRLRRRLACEEGVSLIYHESEAPGDLELRHT